jgi:hypothetical protein
LRPRGRPLREVVERQAALRGWSAAKFRVDICDDSEVIRSLFELVPAAVHTSGPPYVAIAVPIVVAVVVAFWVARRGPR